MPLAQPPAVTAGLISFPARRLRVGEVLYRIHVRDKGVFWFSSLPSGENRYDLPHPHGSCYTARSPTGAWLEIYRTSMTVDLAELRRRRLAAITVPVDLDLADLTADLVRSFGITAEIHVTDADDYRLPRAWAAALHAAGWRGLEGRARHHPVLAEGTVTLFDSAGAHDPFGREWTAVTSDLATEWDLHDDVRRFGYTVVMPVPHDVPTTSLPPDGAL